MAKVKSFYLRKGTRVGAYRILENIGRGWEGEVYKVAEVPTEAIRALKLFRNDGLDSIRHLTHFAWYYEQLRNTGHFPIYHHYGQWFLDDDNGCWFIVFEFIEGKALSALKSSESLFLKLASAVAKVHEQGYAVGDFGKLDNVIVRNESIVFIDCDPGKPDGPNTNFKNDCKTELPNAAKCMFGESKPGCINELLKQLSASKRITRNTLEKALAQI